MPAPRAYIIVGQRGCDHWTIGVYLTLETARPAMRKAMLAEHDRLDRVRRTKRAIDCGKLQAAYTAAFHNKLEALGNSLPPDTAKFGENRNYKVGERWIGASRYEALKQIVKDELGDRPERYNYGYVYYRIISVKLDTPGRWVLSAI